MPAEFRLYEPLLLERAGDDARDFIERLNPDSLTVQYGFVEPALLAAQPGERFQFLRVGYFCADPGWRVRHAGVQTAPLRSRTASRAEGGTHGQNAIRPEPHGLHAPWQPCAARCTPGSTRGTTAADFILRIEDTDRGRYVEGAVEVIYRTLRSIGLDWDEGPDVGGDYGPYVQSERQALYLPYAERLVREGKAYYCSARRRSWTRAARPLPRAARPSSTTSTACACGRRRWRAAWPRASRTSSARTCRRAARRRLTM